MYIDLFLNLHLKVVTIYFCCHCCDHRCCRPQLLLTTGVIYIGGKFSAGVFDTDTTTAGVVELSGLLRNIFIKHLALPKKSVI
jgi:hypothetical protein